jgi:hypothetical protein
MNAKELADDLESRMPAGYWTPPELLAEAANMIRQQQADITALKCLSNLDMKTKIKQQARITELEEQCLAFQNSAIDLAKQLDKKFPEREELPSNCAKTEELTRTGNMNEPVVWMNEPVAWTNAYCLEMVKEDGESNMWWMPDLAEDIPLFTRPAKTLTDEALIESLAKLEHEQWIKWASTIMQTEKISEGRIARWKDCFKPYSELSEEMKEFDREWARKTLAILRNVNE